jgi:putative ABC transport system permease protein
MPVRLMMTSCQSSTDVIAIHGVDKDLLSVFRKFQLSKGGFAPFEEDVAGALVGSKIARRYSWKVGQNVTLVELDGISFNVRGIMEPRGSTDDFLIYVDRVFLQQAEDEQGNSNYVLVKGRPGVDAVELSRTIDALPFTIQTTTQPEEALVTTILDQLADLVTLSRGVVVIIIIVVLIAVGNAISMATRDRYREFGVMRTLGFPRHIIATMVVGEGLFQGLLGALLGCSAVQFMVWAGWIKSISTCSLTVEFLVGIYQWLVALLVVVVAAGLGSIAPAVGISRLNIIEALRPQE